MPIAVLSLLPLAFACSLVLTWLLVRLGRRAGLLDSPGATGHEKESLRDVPNVGGIAIVLATLLPLVAALLLICISDGDLLRRLLPAPPEDMGDVDWLVDRARSSAPLLLALVLGASVLHVMGLIDDRRGLGPWTKLAVQGIVAAVIVVWFDVRLLTLLPPAVSIALTILWIIVVTNAMNFLDNMDGLAGGVTVIAGALFLAATLLNGQWFIGATLALLVGATAGFLVFNLPPARIFMGDGGSLVIGFLFAVLTARTTFLHPELGGGDYAVLMPVIVLAVPLYDFVTVSIIRLRAGVSPMTGDQRHFSHRLVQRGMSKRGAVFVIWCATAVTGIGGIALGSLASWQAMLVGVQTLLVLASLAVMEHATRHVAREPGA